MSLLFSFIVFLLYAFSLSSVFIDLVNNTTYPKEVECACSIMVQLGV